MCDEKSPTTTLKPGQKCKKSIKVDGKNLSIKSYLQKYPYKLGIMLA
jgi:hypothetical protein